MNLRDSFSLQETLSYEFDYELLGEAVDDLKCKLAADSELARRVCSRIALNVALITERSGYYQSVDLPPGGSREEFAEEVGRISISWAQNLEQLITSTDPWPEWPPAIAFALAAELIEAKE